MILFALLITAIATIRGCLTSRRQTNVTSYPYAVAMGVKTPARRSSAPEISDEILKRMTPIFGFKQERDSPALLFCKFHGEEFEHHPAVLVHDTGGWRSVDMDDDAFDQSTWVYVGATIDRERIWGVIDMDVEDPGWDLNIVFSFDKGRSWRHIGTVTKPIYLAWFDSLWFGPSGRGRLTAYLPYAPYSNGRASSRLLRGYYTYYTHDLGRHWSGPRFSPRKPRRSQTSLVHPSYVSSAEGPFEIDQLKSLMARLER
jgi:hypothetical protein